MGISRTVSEINRDFSQKSQIFPTPVYLTPPLKGFSLEFGNGASGRKKLEWRGYQMVEKVLRYVLAVQTQYRRVTDIQPSFDSQDRPFTRCV